MGYLPALYMVTTKMREKKNAYDILLQAPALSGSTKYLHACILNAWIKLDEYSKTIDDCLAYYSAMALHPAIKCEWFIEKWGREDNDRR